MPAPLSRDSLSRCDSSYTIYDAIRNPNARPPIVKPSERSSVDSIESTQSRLNREIFERFKTSGLRLPHESFVVAVQVGKYVLLAIMLPPYLCLYGLPKWLLLSALPQCFFFVKFQIFKVGKFLSKMAKKVPDLMKGLIEQMLGNSIKIAKDQAKNIMKYIIRGVTFFPRKIYQAHRELQRVVAEHILMFKDSCEKLANKVKKKVQKRIAATIRVLKKPFQVFGKISHAIANAFTTRAEPYYKKTLEFFHTLTTFKKRIFAFKSHLRKFALAPRKIAISFLQWISVKTPPVVETINFFLQKQIRKAQRQISKVTTPCFSKIKSFVKSVSKVVSSVYSGIHSFFQTTVNKSIQMALWVGSYLIFPIQKGKETARKIYSATIKKGKRVKQILNGLVSGLKHSRKWLSQKSKQAFAFSAKATIVAIQKVVETIKKMPSLLWRLFIRFWFILLTIANGMIYGGRVFLAMMLAICKLGFLLAQELFHELAYKK